MRYTKNLIAVSVLLFLPGLTADGYGCDVQVSKAKAAEVQIQLIKCALDVFKLDMGRFPSNQEYPDALRNPPQNASNWRGPYLYKDIPLDPWGMPYMYHYPPRYGTGKYDLYSTGLNQKDDKGALDDITSWKETNHMHYQRSSDSENIMVWIWAIGIPIMISRALFRIKCPSFLQAATRHSFFTVASIVIVFLTPFLSDQMHRSFLINIITKSSLLGCGIFSVSGLKSNILANFEQGFNPMVFTNYIAHSTPWVILLYSIFIDCSC